MKFFFFSVFILFSSIFIHTSESEVKKPRKHRSLPEDKMDKMLLPLPINSNEIDLKKPSRSQSVERGEKQPLKSSGRVRTIIGYSEKQTIILPEKALPLIKEQKLVCETGESYGVNQFQFSTVFSIEPENRCPFLQILVPCAKRIRLPQVSFSNGKGGAEIVKFILENELYKNCLIQDKKNTTVLHIVVSQYDLKTVKEMLFGSPMPWVITSAGNTILHYLFLKPAKKKKVISELIEHLYRYYNELTNDLMLNYQNKKKNTALHLACKNLCFSGIEAFVESGARLNIEDSERKSPIDILLKHYFFSEREKKRLSMGEKTEKNKKKIETVQKKKTRLLKIIEMMLSKNAPVFYVDEKGNSPLHTALKNGCNTLISLLARSKVCQNKQNKQGDTPAHSAIKSGVLEYLPLLCEVGELLDIKNNEGYTVLGRLFHVLFKELPESNQEKDEKLRIHHILVGYVKLLLEWGADPNSYCDEEGNNALHYACLSNNPKLVDLLMKHGIDACKKNKNEETVLHVAIRNAWTDEEILLLFFKNNELLLLENKHGDLPYNLIQLNTKLVEIFNKAQGQKKDLI